MQNMTDRHITPELFDFLRKLKVNNDREWFKENRVRYQTYVQEPLLQFIREFDFRLRAISPQFLADARKNGGSLFRIYRDIRFSKDKSPYKTAGAVQFRHRDWKDAHAPCFYLHLEPAGSFLAMGIWRPDLQTLNKLRQGIVRQPDRWRSITGAPGFRSRFVLSGDRLKRPPKGFPPDHPLIEDLKWRDYVVSRELTEDEVQMPSFIDDFAADCSLGAPFVRFLTESLGLRW